MRMEVDESGDGCSVLECRVKPVVAEGLPPVAEPERRIAGEPVGPAQPHVAVDGTTGAGPERHPPSFAALATLGDCDPVTEVDVRNGHVHDLACPHAGLDHQP